MPPKVSKAPYVGCCYGSSRPSGVPTAEGAAQQATYHASSQEDRKGCESAPRATQEQQKKVSSSSWAGPGFFSPPSAETLPLPKLLLAKSAAKNGKPAP